MPMRIQILSDLHLEVDPHRRFAPAPDIDLLVLAGDVGSYQTGSLLDRANPDFGLSQFSPKYGDAGWPRVLYVPGNHEYDLLDFDQTHARLRDTAQRLGIDWLERETLAIGDVRFIGTTLWSDFDGLADPADVCAQALTHRLRRREKAFRAANFYLEKAGTVRNGQIFLAADMREHSLLCQQWLREALRVPFEGATVVVTHFAPSLRSADPRYGMTPGTAGFCNALDDLLPQADLWIHGHLHCPVHYQAEPPDPATGKRCRVVANPLGYALKKEQAFFRENFVVTVP